MGNGYEKKEEIDLQQQKLEGDLIYKENLDWLEEQEARNLGNGKLVRHGDVGCYPGWEDGNTGLPAGLPLSFGDKDFKKKLMNSTRLEESLPKWKWHGEPQDLSDPLATDEKIERIYLNLKDMFKGVKDRSESTRYSYVD